MKIQKSIGNTNNRRSGFTLIELLAVVAIILILAAITVTGIGAFQKMQARKATTTTIKFIETKMEEYKLDNGAYPDPSAGAGDNSTVKTAYLLAGLTSTGGIPPEGRTEVYWADLNPKNGKNLVSSTWQILDSYGQPFRLRGKEAGSVNPDFDLWSIGPDGQTNATTPTDPKNADDIRNF